MSHTKDENALNQQMQNEEELWELLKKRREKLNNLQAEGKNPYDKTRFNPTHYSQDILDNFEEMEGREVTIAGRIMSEG